MDNGILVEPTDDYVPDEDQYFQIIDSKYHDSAEQFFFGKDKIQFGTED